MTGSANVSPNGMFNFNWTSRSGFHDAWYEVLEYSNIVS